MVMIEVMTGAITDVARRPTQFTMVTMVTMAMMGMTGMTTDKGIGLQRGRTGSICSRIELRGSRERGS
jgi:hypothetical protein